MSSESMTKKDKVEKIVAMVLFLFLIVIITAGLMKKNEMQHLSKVYDAMLDRETKRVTNSLIPLESCIDKYEQAISKCSCCDQTITENEPRKTSDEK